MRNERDYDHLLRDNRRLLDECAELREELSAARKNLKEAVEAIQAHGLCATVPIVGTVREDGTIEYN